MINWLQEKTDIENIKEFYPGIKSGYGCVFYEGDLYGTHVFIKLGGIATTIPNEYNCMKIMYNNNVENFIKPMLYYVDNDNAPTDFYYDEKYLITYTNQFIVMEFVKGQNLLNYFEKNLVNRDNKRIIKQGLIKIAKSLLETKIIHRDINLKNLIICDDGTLKLGDFQFALNYNKLNEYKNFLENTKSIKLNKNFSNPDGVYDDMYSINKILAFLGMESEFIKENIGKLSLKFL